MTGTDEREKRHEKARETGSTITGRLLADRQLTGAMPWIIGIMLFLTTLAAGAGLSLWQSARTIGADLDRKLTVQIVEADPPVRAELTRRVVEQLGREPGVVAVSAVDEAEVRELIAPYLGETELDPDLPVPGLVDARLDEAGEARTDAISANLAKISRSIRVDRNSKWLSPVTGLLTFLTWLSAGLVLLMAIATAATVILTARAALTSHKPTIDTLHLMGATDAQVAGLFERRIGRDATIGAAAGFAGGLVVFLIVIWRMSAIDEGPGSGMGSLFGLPALWVILPLMALVPLAAVMLARGAARMTVLNALRRLL